MKRHLFILPILLMFQAAHAHDENPFTPEFRRCEAKTEGVTPDAMDCIDKEFNIINSMRQTPYGDASIEFHQSQLGHSIGLVQPPKPKPSWSFKT